MTALVIDTSLAACQVGRFEAGRMLAGLSEPMERGHQERLAPMAAEIMAGARFELPETAINARKAIRIRIEDVDGAAAELSE